MIKNTTLPSRWLDLFKGWPVPERLWTLVHRELAHDKLWADWRSLEPHTVAWLVCRTARTADERRRSVSVAAAIYLDLARPLRELGADADESADLARWAEGVGDVPYTCPAPVPSVNAAVHLAVARASAGTAAYDDDLWKEAAIDIALALEEPVRRRSVAYKEYVSSYSLEPLLQRASWCDWLTDGGGVRPRGKANDVSRS